MTATRELSELGTMILLWLLTRNKKGGTRGALGTALAPNLKQHWSGAEQRSLIDEELAALKDAGQITHAKKSQVVVTDEGKRAILTVIGVAALPGKGDWRSAKKYLLVPALALPAIKGSAKRSFDADHLRADILRQSYQLAISENAPLLQAIDAFVWSKLGIENTGPLDVNVLRAHYLNLEVNAQKPHKDPKKAAAQLAAKIVEARRADASTLELTVISRWLKGTPVVPRVADLDHETVTVAKPNETVATPNVAVERELISDDKSFAARVLEVARASKTGRFGEHKVFISHVFRKLVDEGAIADDAKSFKDRLISAHRDERLTLSRADLVGAMKPEDVDSSEAKYLGATFHFIHV